MAPYTKKVKVRYDGKNLVLDEPLDLPLNGELEVTIESYRPPLDTRPIEERLEALSKLGGIKSGVILSDDAFRRDENMYP